MPECSDNSNSGSIAVNKYLNVTCVLEFVGNLIPNFTWLDHQGKSIENASFAVGQNFVSTILVKATMPLIGPLQFVTWMPDVPGVLYFWNSTSFAVCKSTLHTIKPVCEEHDTKTIITKTF